MLSVLLVSVIISSISSRPTQAESLLYKTTCGLAQLLGVQCKPTPATGPPSSSGSGSGQSATTPSNRAAAPTPSNQPASQPESPSFTPMNLPDQQLPIITPISSGESTRATTPRDFVGYSLPTIRGADENSGSAVLGATIRAPLQSSAEGWKIFGIAWYWWVVMIAAIIALGRLVAERFRTHRQLAARLAKHS